MGKMVAQMQPSLHPFDSEWELTRRHDDLYKRLEVLIKDAPDDDDEDDDDIQSYDSDSDIDIDDVINVNSTKIDVNLCFGSKLYQISSDISFIRTGKVLPDAISKKIDTLEKQISELEHKFEELKKSSLSMEELD